MNQADLHIQVQNSRFLIFQSSNGSSSDQVTLPLSPLNLHSCYFKIHSGFNLTSDDKKFAQISWEVLTILKENFPSKIFLSQDNLDLCKPQYTPMSPQEELRRQISCLMSIKEEGRYLTVDEIEDTWHTLQQAEKINDQRSLSICLEIMQQQTQNWGIAKNIVENQTLLRIVNKNDYTTLTSNKIMASDIIEKITAAGNGKNEDCNETIQRQINALQCEDTLSLAGSDCGTLDYNGTNQTLLNFEKPTSTRMCLFQLSESNDINRVTMILETLAMKSKETLSQLRKKYNLNSKLMTVLKKYCNAEYGFEQQSSRNGTFQHNLVKLFIVLTKDYVVFLECLQGQTLEYMSQLIEEAIIYGYEDALSGASNSNHTSLQTQQFIQTTQGLNSDLFKFLNNSLDFIELVISKQFQEFLPQVRENLRKVQARMIKLFQKKDNAMLAFFIQNLASSKALGESKALDLPKIADSLNTTDMVLGNDITIRIEQLSELRQISEGLYIFAVDLNNKIQKIEAIVDLQEDYEEKYQRLFFKFIGPTVSIAFDQAREKQKLEPEKQRAPTRVQFEIQNETRHKAQKENYSSNYSQNHQINDGFTSNVFQKNQAEISNFKRPSQNNQKLPPQGKNIYHSKENETHFIGSPIKPVQRNVNEKYYTGRDSLERFN